MITLAAFGNYGRIGNQLFQYAALKRIALKNNYELRLPAAQTFEEYQRTSKGNCMAEFNVEYKPLLEEHIKIMEHRVYREPQGRGYISQVLNVPDNTNVIGYFQSEKYFQPIADSIKKELTFRDKSIIEKAKNFVEDVKVGENSVTSLHIRRGDYVKKADKYPFPGWQYYKKAISLIGGESKIIVVSDDIEWCQTHLQGKNITYSVFKNALEDLALMTVCDNNIIANSTFSWWGAWLNNNLTKKVIAPKKWFGSGFYIVRTPLKIKFPYTTKDLLPKAWIKI